MECDSRFLKFHIELVITGVGFVDSMMPIVKKSASRRAVNYSMNI